MSHLTVIAVDTGNKNIKTPHTEPFNAGVIKHGKTAPAISVDTLCLDGEFFSLTESRVPTMYDKTETNDYYILTLFAIAKELLVMEPGFGRYESDVCLALGLPPTHLQALQKKYVAYFGHGGEKQHFTYNGIDFNIRIPRVEVFPQGYSAIVPFLAEIGQKPRSYIIDIGGYTTDVIQLQRGVPDMQFCESLNCGALRMFDQIKRALRNQYRFDADDYMVDCILRGNVSLDDEMKATAKEAAAEYAKNLIRSLEEMGVDLRLAYPVFIGGGANLMKDVIVNEVKCKEFKCIDDVRANALGYAILAKGRLAKNNNAG